MELAVGEMTVSGDGLFTGGLYAIYPERKQVELHQELLVAELDHRVKNVLAQVAGGRNVDAQGSHSLTSSLRSLKDASILGGRPTPAERADWQSVGLDALAATACSLRDGPRT